MKNRSRSWHKVSILTLTISSVMLAAMIFVPTSSRTQVQTSSDAGRNGSAEQAPGQADSDRGVQKSTALENYDVRIDTSKDSRALVESYNKRLGRRQQLKIAETREAFANAAADLRKDVPGLKVEHNPATGAPEIVDAASAGPNFLTKPSNDGHETIVRRFLEENESLYGLTRTQVDQLELVADYTNPGGNLSWVEFEQRIHGIPVFQGYLRGAFTSEGALARTTSNLVAGLDYERLSPTPAMTAPSAVQAAAQAIGITVDRSALGVKTTSDQGRVSILSRGPFIEDVKTELVYFPLAPGLAVLSYSMVLWEENSAYYIVVDADSGRLLWRKNIVDEQTQNVTYKVYNDDSPSPLSPTNVLPSSPTQAAGILRTTFTLISELPAFDNLGWITDGGNTTTGNNVDAGLDIDGTNGIDAAGATYRNSYIEIFNRGTNTVNLNSWVFQFTSSATGSFDKSVSFSNPSTNNIPILPGQHLLIQLASSGSSGTALPVTPDFSVNLPSPAPQFVIGLSGKIAITKPGTSLLSGPCPLPNSNVVDFVGYGSAANCFEGGGPVPTLTNTTAALRRSNGCTDTGNNVSDFTVGATGPRNGSSPIAPCSSATPTFEPVVLTPSQVEIKTWTFQGRTYAYLKLLFPNAGYRVVDFGQAVRAGNDFTGDASVERFTGASVQALTTTAGIYDLGILSPGSYNFIFKNSGTVVRTLAFTVAAPPFPPNPIDTAGEFVGQQYRDFLNREADPAGLAFWTDNITKCNDPARRPPGQTVEQCTLRQRETTSGAFFLSPEFQYTGYFVYRMYQGALGRQPKLSEFVPDAQFVGAGIVVNGQLSGAVINQNKANFAAQFVNCTDATKSRCEEFKAIYDLLNNQQYVDALFVKTGANPTASERAALVNGLNAIPATETRASVLQKVVDGIFVISEGNQRFDTTYGQAFYNSEFNRAFVQLQYFGYMKRDPDEAGYAFWLGKLNQFNGNFVNAEMVLAFISSPEYRARFGQP